MVSAVDDKLNSNSLLVPKFITALFHKKLWEQLTLHTHYMEWQYGNINKLCHGQIK